MSRSWHRLDAARNYALAVHNYTSFRLMSLIGPLVSELCLLRIGKLRWELGAVALFRTDVPWFGAVGPGEFLPFDDFAVLVEQPPSVLGEAVDPVGGDAAGSSL